MRLSLIFSYSEEAINLALTELNNGESFTEVAKKFSMGPNKENGGDIGYVQINDIHKIFQNEALKLTVGEYSNVISGENEYYIIMKTDERTVTVPFDKEKLILNSILAFAFVVLILGVVFGIKNHVRIPKYSISLPDGILTVYGDGNKSQDSVENTELKGARLVVFEYCISLIVITFKRTSPAYFIGPHDNTLPKAIPFISISLLFGWWGFPWGPIYTISSIYKNLRGGIQVAGK